MLIRIKQGFRKLKFSLDLRHELAADTLKNQTKNNHQMIAIEQLKEVGKIWLAWVLPKSRKYLKNLKENWM